MHSKPTIAVVYYSTYGHVAAMANEVAKGIEQGGGQALKYQVRETLPEVALEAMKAPTKDDSVPYLEHANVEKLTQVRHLTREFSCWTCDHDSEMFINIGPYSFLHKIHDESSRN
jgi:hypothetical protein